MMDLNKLKKICFECNFIRSQYIYKLIECGILNNQLEKLEFKEVKTTMYSTFKNGMTDTYNLFILNLDKFLMFFDLNFITNPNEKFIVLQNIFENVEADFLLSTKDINKERNFYILEYKKLIVSNFFKSLLKLNKIPKFNKIIKSAVKMEEISFDDENDINTIFNFLKKIINCSRDDVRFLFYDLAICLNNDLYMDILYSLFDNYQKKHKYLELLGL